MIASVFLLFKYGQPKPFKIMFGFYWLCLYLPVQNGFILSESDVPGHVR